MLKFYVNLPHSGATGLNFEYEQAPHQTVRGTGGHHEAFHPLVPDHAGPLRDGLRQ